MTRLPLRVACLLLALAPLTSAAQPGPVTVTPDAHGAALITLPNGKITRVPKERGQVGISDPQSAADDRTVGWLVDYGVEGFSYPVAETLVIWRDGKVRRRFGTDQLFYSWAFHSRGEQVAFHTGPGHGEQKSHCELHDIKTGRKVAEWDGDLESRDKPEWVAGLKH